MSTKRSQSSLVEREAASFASQKSNFPRRSKALTPTREEIQSTSFTEYVQHALFDDDYDSDQENGVKAAIVSLTPDEEQNRPSTCTSGAAATLEAKRAKQLRNRLIRWDDGVVKITLPKGWWDEAGIAKDRTARGPAWQAGTKLGDMMVEGPIKQQIAGIGGIYEYALFDTPAMTLSEYRLKADEYRKQQLGNSQRNVEKKKSDDVDDENKDSKQEQPQESLEPEYLDDEACDDLARQFWRRLGPTTPPSIYGADMEGSLFDGDKASGWSLEGLDNCLQLLSAAHCEDMPGVTTPYLYVGMWGSVFCAHTEDMNLLSINYLHAGAPKYWYAIAPEHSARFESLAESHFVHAARDCPQFLRHKQTMLSPAILKKAGVPFQVQVQRPGDAIITCPGAYHFGVNLGFNVAEATNFAIPEWVVKGREAKVCMCRPHAVRIDVDRFSTLLKKYEHDMDNAAQIGFPRLPYLRWTLLEASRRKLASAAAAAKPEGVASSAPCGKAETPKSTKKAAGKKTKKAAKVVTVEIANPNDNSDSIAKDKDFWVEVMRPLNENGKGRHVVSKGKSKRRKTPTAPTEIEYLEEWRLAKPHVQRKKPLTLDTKVLCLLPGRKEGENDDEQAEDEECFAGVVVEIVDDHCRIHFAGLKKEEDVWMSVSSKKLFLDGGKWAEPSKAAVKAAAAAALAAAIKTPPAKNKKASPASTKKKTSPASTKKKTSPTSTKTKGTPVKKKKAPVKKKTTSAVKKNKTPVKAKKTPVKTKEAVSPKKRISPSTRTKASPPKGKRSKK